MLKFSQKHDVLASAVSRTIGDSRTRLQTRGAAVLRKNRNVLSVAFAAKHSGVAHMAVAAVRVACRRVTRRESQSFSEKRPARNALKMSATDSEAALFFKGISPQQPKSALSSKNKFLSFAIIAIKNKKNRFRYNFERQKFLCEKTSTRAVVKHLTSRIEGLTNSLPVKPCVSEQIN